MRRQIGGAGGRSASSEVGRARHENTADLPDLASDQPRFGHRPDPHGHVEAFLHEVDVAVLESQLDLRLRKASRKAETTGATCLRPNCTGAVTRTRPRTAPSPAPEIADS